MISRSQAAVRFHALPPRARQEYASTEEKNVSALNLVVAYLRRKSSVGAHEGERVIDVNNPYGTEKGLFLLIPQEDFPVGELVNACFDESEFQLLDGEASSLRRVVFSPWDGGY